eukprot:6860962-Prymnesium_polylepis.2
MNPAPSASEPDLLRVSTSQSSLAPQNDTRGQSGGRRGVEQILFEKRRGANDDNVVEDECDALEEVLAVVIEHPTDRPSDCGVQACGLKHAWSLLKSQLDAARCERLEEICTLRERFEQGAVDRRELHA